MAKAIMKIRKTLMTLKIMMSEPEPRPKRLFFDLRGQTGCKLGTETAQQRAFGSENRKPHFIAVYLFHLGNQMANTVGQTEVNASHTCPERPIKKLDLFGETLRTGSGDMGDESLVDVFLKRLDPRHVFGIFRPERVHLAFRFA